MTRPNELHLILLVASGEKLHRTDPKLRAFVSAYTSSRNTSYSSLWINHRRTTRRIR